MVSREDLEDWLERRLGDRPEDRRSRALYGRLLESLDAIHEPGSDMSDAMRANEEALAAVEQWRVHWMACRLVGEDPVTQPVGSIPVEWARAWSSARTRREPRPLPQLTDDDPEFSC